MVKINVHSEEQISSQEMLLLSTMVSTLSTNEEFFTDNEPMYSNQFTMTRKSIDDNGEEEIVYEGPTPYDFFVSAVHKGLNTKLEITIDTAEGPKTQVRQFAPITLVDIPMMGIAAVYLNERPEFLPSFKDGRLTMKFGGDLVEFVHQDIDEQADEDSDDTE